MLTHILKNNHVAQDGAMLRESVGPSKPIKVFYGDSENFTGELSPFYNYLSKKEIERSKQFIREADERTYVISHAMVNKSIAKQLGVKFNHIEVNYFDKKKPFVSGIPIDFNLSHSSNFFTYVIAPNQGLNLGIDIEIVRERFNIESIVNYYFHNNEIAYIMGNELDTYKKKLRFYELWTRKEALLKMLGIGLTEDLSQIDVTHGKRDITVHNNSPFDVRHFANIYVNTLELSNNIIISLSTNQPVIITPVECTLLA